MTLSDGVRKKTLLYSYPYPETSLDVFLLDLLMSSVVSHTWCFHSPFIFILDSCLLTDSNSILFLSLHLIYSGKDLSGNRQMTILLNFLFHVNDYNKYKEKNNIFSISLSRLNISPIAIQKNHPPNQNTFIPKQFLVD